MITGQEILRTRLKGSYKVTPDQVSYGNLSETVLF